jgi:hypothetical protein
MKRRQGTASSKLLSVRVTACEQSSIRILAGKRGKRVSDLVRDGLRIVCMRECLCDPAGGPLCLKCASLARDKPAIAPERQESKPEPRYASDPHCNQIGDERQREVEQARFAARMQAPASPEPEAESLPDLPPQTAPSPDDPLVVGKSKLQALLGELPK